MLPIQKTFNSIELAKTFGRDLYSIPMQNGSTVKILCDENNIDSFVVKKGKILERSGAKGSVEFIENQLGKILEKVQKYAKDGIDVCKCQIPWHNIK